MRNIIKKAAVCITVITVMLFILPVTVKAAQVGNFMVEGGNSDDYEYANGVLYIKTGTALTIKNAVGVTTTTDRIEVENGVSANITLAGVHIDVSSIEDAAAFKIADNSKGNVTITLADGTTNELKSGKNCAGLQKNAEDKGSLTIGGGTLGTGILIAAGGEYGAGIGGGGYTACAFDITIESGTVIATGGESGAGIGGGFGGNASDITIESGTVTATGGESGAGIGGGEVGMCNNIIIGGGSVKVVAGTGASVIGGGRFGNGGYTPTNGTANVYLITIDNFYNMDVYIDGELYAPKNHKTAEQSDGNLYAYLTGEAHTVMVDGTIKRYDLNNMTNTFVEIGTDFMVSATNANQTLIYGVDYTYPKGDVLTIESGKNITIKNAEGVATADDCIKVMSGIFANITLAGVNIDVSQFDEKAAFKIADNSVGSVTITLADGTTNVLQSGKNCAGLQKKSESSMGWLVINGDTLGTGSLYVEGGENGAGIGGGNNESSAYIRINGGTVTAKGGENGAGIGGGNSKEGLEIQICGGSVKAVAGGSAENIGSGGNMSGMQEYRPTDTEGSYVYRLIINNPEDKDVNIDGNLYVPKNHKAAEQSDGNLYAYLIGETHVVRVGDSETIYIFDSATRTFKTSALVITGDDEPLIYDTDFSYISDILVINTNKAVTIKNADGVATTDEHIEVKADVSASITLAGVNIDMSSVDVPAFKIEDYSTGNVTITLADGTTNVLKSGSDRAGLQKISDADDGILTIRGDTLGTGSLYVEGGENGAGIGGGLDGTAANITIEGGSVTAKGGENGAGIGGSNGNEGMNIRIIGGSVKVYPGNNANAIGGGAGKAAVTPTNGTAAVYHMSINNPYDKDVYIDGELYVPKNHKVLEAAGADGALHAYLTGETHVVRVGDSETVYVFDSALQGFKKPDLVIAGGFEVLTYGTDYTYENGILTIKSIKYVTIKNADGVTTTTDRIEVADGVAADIAFAGVHIDVSSIDNAAAFKIADNSADNVIITLADGTTNVLKSGKNCAGLQKKSESNAGRLIINGDTHGTGVLIAEGGENGAGIGGGANENSTYIRINGGTVTARGGKDGAGIGGGNNGNGNYIQICGGSVKALAGDGASDIGLGGNMSLSLKEHPKNGIGANVYFLIIDNSSDKDVYIDGERYAPKNHKAAEPSDGNLYVYLSNKVHTVKVGDTIKKYDFDNTIKTFVEIDTDFIVSSTVAGAALYYGTDYTYPKDSGVLTINSDKLVTIKNAEGVTTTTNRIVVKADVSAKITLAGVNIDVSGIANTPAFIIENYSDNNVNITLADGTTNVLKSGSECAGLQKINDIDEGMLTISGGTLGTGSLYAEGGEHGAGIGAGFSHAVANITIKGGIVTAKGGKYGAGIGGAYNSEGVNIRICGGSVKAIAGADANAIGGGKDVGAVTPTNGTANVYLLTVSNPDDKNVYIDGELYTPKNHKAAEPADGNLYVYVTGVPHTVKLGENGKTEMYVLNGSVFEKAQLVITGDDDTLIYGTDYSYADSILTILSGKAVTIKNADGVATTTDRIEVAAGVSAKITLAGVNIDVSSIGDTPAFKIADDSMGNVTITLAAGTTNSLRSGIRSAGLQKNGDYISETQGRLTITGEGSLTAYSVGGGAGIGASSLKNSSNITISGGVINAQCGSRGGAGIGGGAANDGVGHGSHITISGGTVTAIGGEYGAGIGGGGVEMMHGGNGSDILIIGGSVKAVAGANANAIGGGRGKAAVTPTNGTANVYLLTVSNPDDKNVYIDGELYTPKNHKAVAPADGNLYVYVTGVPHTVKLGENGKTEMYVLNGSVFEKAQLVITGDDDTLIYGTDYSYADSILTILSGKAVTIKNADGVATTTDRIEVADGVSAKITLAGVNIDVSGIDDTPAFKIADDSTGNVTITLAAGTANSLRSGKRSAGLQKNGDYISETQGRLTIMGEGSLTAYSVGGGAGIGASIRKNSSNITISGGVINAQCGSSYGAGIGGGAANYGVGHGSHITISGGTVTAIGGEYAAGIGGGSLDMLYGGDGSDILISGGTVIARGGERGAGIGGGYYGNASNIIIEGGTVTATGGPRGAGIGVGMGPCTCSDIKIKGGSVKAVAGTDSVAIGGVNNGAVTPTNGTKNVYPFTITNTGGAAVLIDGSNYLPINHSAADASDKNLYVYLTAEAHTVKVGDTIKRYDFDSTANTFVELATELMISATNAGETLIYGTDYTYLKFDGQATSDVLMIKSDKAVTIKNADGVTTSDDFICVWSGVSANITLAGVNIDCSSRRGGPAFSVNDSTGNVTITLAAGTVNVLKSGETSAGLEKNGNYISETQGRLTITGEGSLTAYGGGGGAGIGGGANSVGANIRITGGSVTAIGGEYAAGIGGGANSVGTNIIIKGGSVKAVAGTNANAIGGGAGKAAVIPTNGTENVYLKIIENTDAEEIKINGTTYQASHNEETRIYAYLPAKTVTDANKVTVGTVTTKWCYAASQTKWLEVVDIPDADTTVFTYSGREQTYNIAESGCYSISGNKQTNADDYTVTVTLNADTIWSDGTTDSKPYLFKISKAEPVISITLVPASATVGNTIAVSAVAKNPYNDAVADIPDVEISYKIGTGKVTALTKGSFVIPSDTADDTRIIITAVTAESSNYTAGNTEITIRCINEAEYTNDILLNGKACDWPSAVLELSKLPAGSAVTIELDGDYEIPAEVIKKIADNEIKATFIVKDWAGWYIDGADITAFTDENLSIFQVFSSGTALLRGTTGVMFRIAGVNNPATLMISVGKEHAGKFANLYKTDGGKPVFVDNVRVDEDGCVWLDDIAESGNYVIMLSDYSDRSGDADNDGRLTALDAAEILRHIVGINAAANPEMIDYNGDGKANALDASQILRDIVYGKN